MLAIEHVSTPDATVGVYYAGAGPYFVHRRYVDFCGKSDTYIARLPARAEWVEFRQVLPGHNKWSWPYAIGKRKPDIVTTFREGGFLKYSRDFQRNYKRYRLKDDPDERATLWVRTGSPNLDWSRIELARDWDPRLSIAVDDPSPDALRMLGYEIR